MKQIFSFVTGVLFLVFVTYGILTYLDKDVGELVDWTIGVLAFLWLTTLVTVPWNAHFKAKEV